MLKKIMLNKRYIPVPIPLTNLSQGLSWVESTLVQNEQVITKIVFNGREIVDYGSADNLKSIKLSDQDRVEFMVESPMDLTLQVMEAIRNISSILCQILKPAAVSFWQMDVNAKAPKEMFDIKNDVDMVHQLCEQFIPMADGLSLDKSIVDSISVQLKDISSTLEEQIQKKDWKQVSRILLNKLELQLDQIIQETARLQSYLLSNKTRSRANMQEVATNKVSNRY